MIDSDKYLKIGNGIHPKLKGLKGRKFVYFLLRGKRIVYIGCSINIQQRISQHKSGFWIKKWFTHCRIIECKTHNKALKYESRWIKKFKPKYNWIKKPSGSDLEFDQWYEMRGLPLPKWYSAKEKCYEVLGAID